MTAQNSSFPSGRAITAHPLFPTGVGVWFAALFSLSSLAIRGSLLEGLIVLTHIDYLIPAASPPLGALPRMLMALGIAALGFYTGRKVGRKIAQSEAEAEWTTSSPVFSTPPYQEHAPFAQPQYGEAPLASAPYGDAAYTEGAARRPFQVHEEVGGYYPSPYPAPDPYPAHNLAEPGPWGHEASGHHPGAMGADHSAYYPQGPYHPAGQAIVQGAYQPSYQADYPAGHQPQYDPPQYNPAYQPDHQALHDGQPYAVAATHAGYAENPSGGQWHGAPPAGEAFALHEGYGQGYAPGHNPEPLTGPEPAYAPGDAGAGGYSTAPQPAYDLAQAASHDAAFAHPAMTPPQEAVSWLHSSEPLGQFEAVPEAFFAGLPEPSRSAAPAAFEADQSLAPASAAERIAGDPLEKLSHLELVERLALAMQRYEASEPAGVAEPVPDMAAPMPAGSFPFTSLASQLTQPGEEPAKPARSALAALRGLK